MGWLSRGALVAGVISVAACTPPEPPRDGGPRPEPDDATVLEVPVDLLISDDATAFLNQSHRPPADGGCALPR